MSFISLAGYLVLNCFTFGQNVDTAVFDSYQDYRPECHAQTMVWLHQNNAIFDSIASELDQDKIFAMSIVSPEVSRYQELIDAGQTSGNRIFYTRFGHKISDMSTGRFQMKPSFAEGLEKEISKHPEWKKLQILTHFSGTSEAEFRKERLDRLEDVRGQLYYLMAFIQVMDQRCSARTFNDTEEKLSWYAMAYNKGFEAPDAALETWQNVAYFPNSGKGVNFPYPQVAQEFYNQIRKELP